MSRYAKPLVIAWFVIFSINALCSAILIALINADWINMDGQGRFMVIVAMGMNWTNTIGAFFYSIVKKMDPETFSDLPQTVSTQSVTTTQTKTVDPNQK